MDRVHTFITNMLFYDQSPALMSVLNASDAISEMWLSLHRVRRCWPCLLAVDRSHRPQRRQSQGANLLFQPPTTASTNATTSSDSRSSTRNSTSANGSPPSTSNFETKSRLLVFFLTQLLARHFPGQSLSTFSFQCMAYLQLDHLSLSLSLTNMHGFDCSVPGDPTNAIPRCQSSRLCCRRSTRSRSRGMSAKSRSSRFQCSLSRR